jgi:hypothetical protein
MNLPFKTERIDLPSKGLIYPLDNPLSKGYVDMRYMTAYQEEILTNRNYINKGFEYTIDRFCASLIVDENVNYEDLVEGDRFQILLASRILSYGSTYKFEYYGKEYQYDISKLEPKNIPFELYKNKNEFEFELPIAGIPIKIKCLTHKDLLDIEQENNELVKLYPDDTFLRPLKLSKIITSVNGDYSRETVKEFIENKLIGLDIRHIFEYHNEISPDIVTEIQVSQGGEKLTIPFSYIKLFYDLD